MNVTLFDSSSMMTSNRCGRKNSPQRILSGEVPPFMDEITRHRNMRTPAGLDGLPAEPLLLILFLFARNLRASRISANFY